MSFRKPCHMPFHKHIPPFTLTGVRHNQKAVIKVMFIPIEFLSRLNSMNSKLKKKKIIIIENIPIPPSHIN